MSGLLFNVLFYMFHLLCAVKQTKNLSDVDRKPTYVVFVHALVMSFCVCFQVTRPQLSHGALDVPLHVSPVSVVVVLIALAREPSATCAVVAACLPPQRPGAAGTARST